jgi:hypothetical protein
MIIENVRNGNPAMAILESVYSVIVTDSYTGIPSSTRISSPKTALII